MSDCYHSTTMTTKVHTTESARKQWREARHETPLPESKAAQTTHRLRRPFPPFTFQFLAEIINRPASPLTAAIEQIQNCGSQAAVL